MLYIIGRVRKWGQSPKTTLKHIATSEYTAKHIKVCNFVAIKNHEKFSYFML